MFLWLGALFLPAAIVETAAQTLVLGVTRLGSLVDVAGEHSLLSAAAALLVAGAGHVLAAVIVYGGVAASLSAAEVGPAPGVRETYRLLGTRIRALLGVAIRATVTIVVLALTIIGIPWAILFLGRWSVGAQASAIEGLSGREALARSSALTRGRWWRAARLAALVNIVGASSGPVVGIVLLFISSLPLSTINAVSSVIFVVVMPFAAASMAFLYGDLVARREDDEAEA